MSPADPSDVLSDVARRLHEAKFDYMVTGSVAGWLYGINRSTGDTDIVIDLPVRRAGEFYAAFRDGYFVDPLTVEDSARTRIMFNVMPHRGSKFDFIPLATDAFEREKFRRRVAQDWHGQPLWVATAPDLVLSKLNWARDSHSRQQFADVRAIFAAGAVEESDEYFQRWLRFLDLQSTLDACYSERYDA